MATSKDKSIEHQNVPEAHQGLHDFLYSSEDEHAVTANPPEQASDGTQVLPLPMWCESSTNAKVAGVYEVLDTERATQYIGYSRNVLRSLSGHMAALGPEVCAYVRVQTFNYPQRQAMETLRDVWLSELDHTPAGNAEASKLWTTVGEAAQATMSVAERSAYEEKKLKLRKAMADTTLTHELEASKTSDTKRQQIETALKNDDWSAIIDGQTQETRK